MSAREIYELLFNSFWESCHIEGKVKFIQRGVFGFDIVIIQDGKIIQRHRFANYQFQTADEGSKLNTNKYLIYNGHPNQYIYVLSDESIDVHLPALNNLVLRKCQS